MEVVVAPSPHDFDFNSGRSSSFLSAPSSPRRFGECFPLSAPTSPTRMSDFDREFESFCGIIDGQSIGENSSGTEQGTRMEEDFAFEFRKDSEKASLFAEELFDGGKIRSLKLEKKPGNPPVFSPLRSSISQGKNGEEGERGRERVQAVSKSSSRRAVRSLSPHRVSEYPWEEEQEEAEEEKPQLKRPGKLSPAIDSRSSKSSSKKWSLKDFLLFRSASEGHGRERDPFRKHSAFLRKQEDMKNASFGSTENVNSGSRRRKSAHEIHYRKNKAMTEDLKKKTFLPYKQGILGRLAFIPATHGFGFH